VEHVSQQLNPKSFRRARLWAVSGGHFWVDFYMNLLPAIIPFLVVERGMSLTSLGVVVTTLSLSSAVIQPYLGYLIDRQGRSWFLVLSLAWISVGMSLAGIINNYWLLIGITSLAALGSAVYHPLGSILTTTIEHERKTAALGDYSVMGNLGYSIAPLVTVPLVEKFNLSGLTMFMVPGLLWVLLLLRTGVSKVNLVNEQKQPEPFLASLGSNWLSLLNLNIIVGLRAWVQTIVIVFVPLLYIQQGHSKIEASQLLTIFLISGTMGTWLGGRMADYFSRRKMLVASFLLGGVCFMLFFNSTGLWTWITLAVAGIILQATFSLTVILAQELIPRNAGMASGMMMGLSFGLGSLGSLFTGIIGDHWGLRVAVESLMPILAIAALLSLFFKNYYPAKSPIPK
jgi:FSR family fosmidomycin resistance protein-like MFS transporter